MRPQKNHREPIFLLLLILFFASQVRSEQDQETASELSKIAEDLKLSWQSIESLEITCEEFSCDSAAQQTPDNNSAITQTQMTLATGGRRAIATSLLQPNQPPKHLKKFTEDGKYSYSILPFPDNINSINQIAIIGQKKHERSLQRPDEQFSLVLHTGWNFARNSPQEWRGS